MAVVCRHLTIAGRVQNVFYRDWFIDEATRRGLDGWVRNRADGSVEAVVAGPPEMIETMIARTHAGPSAARVDHIEASDDTSTEPLAGFTKRATR